MKVGPALRELRNVVSIDDYPDRIIRWVTPQVVSVLRVPLNPLDIPYALGYLEAIWKSKTGSYLFFNVNPTSVGRLTQACTSEDSFNSLLSALSDVLGQVVPPGTKFPPQKAALEAFGLGVNSLLELESQIRTQEAINFLIEIRHLRVSTQHGDARHRAVLAFEKLGLPFPPVSWEFAWEHIAVRAKSALDSLREEIHVGIKDPS